MPRECSNCNNELDHLNYRSEVTEYGTHDLDGGNNEIEDSETNEITYSCPECYEEVRIDDFQENTPRSSNLNELMTQFRNQTTENFDIRTSIKATIHLFKEIKEETINPNTSFTAIVNCKKCKTEYETETTVSELETTCMGCKEKFKMDKTNTMILKMG